MTAYLVIREGSKWTDVFRLVDGESITVGRAPTNAIVVKDERCSRNHAEVFQSQGQWMLRDLDSRNGTLVEERQFAGDPFDVPPGAATYRYEQDLARPADIFDLSPRVSAAWTFRSQHVGGDAPRSLPLLTMRFTPPVDQHNQTSARVIVLPIAFQRPPGAGTPLVVRASLEVSFDEGARWSRVPVAVIGDRAFAIVVHPSSATSVSLRSSATDLQGNRVEQTIVRAYGLAP